MGRKSSVKGQRPVRPAVPADSKGKGVNPLVWAILAVAILAVAFVVMRPSGAAVSPAVVETAAAEAEAEAPPRPKPTDAIIARAEALAALGPHQQASLPPIPFQGYTPPRPVEVVTAAYQFAAEHPEVLTYVPCFCGCEAAGHSGSHDCFVKRRDDTGNVVEWDEHGVTCAVCIDVANRSRQLYSSGANVRDIRAAIDKEFASVYPGQMPTPDPPTAHSH